MPPFLSRFFLFLLVSQSAIITSAQKNDTVFFNQYNDVTIKEKACYYALRDSVTNESGIRKWVQKKYYMTHELAQYCWVNEIENNGRIKSVQNGMSKDFYKSGNLKGFYNYKMGKPEGPYEKYYEDGKLKESGRLEGWGNMHIYHFYNRKGMDKLNDGSGTFKDTSEVLNREVYYFVEDSLLKLSCSVDPDYKDTVYLFTGSVVSFAKGVEKRLKRKLSKPEVPSALIKKYSGITLRYRLVIMEDGTVGSVKPLDSVNESINRFIIETIEKYAVFEPALSNGRKVKVYFHFPCKLVYIE